MNRLARDAFKPIVVPMNVESEKYEQIVTQFLETETLAECLQLMATDHIPRASAAKELGDEVSGLWINRIPVSTYANDMLVSRAGSDTEKDRQRVISVLAMQWQINSRILSDLMSRLSAQKGLDADSLFNYIEQWRLADEKNLIIVKVGLERYFSGDYVSAMHILVPQFEDILRTMFEKAGHPVIRPRRGVDGWQLETFGDFLRRDFVKETLTPDQREYIQFVMTEQTGLNLRNDVAHGSIDPTMCTKPVLDTVLHLFLMLTLYGLVPVDPPIDL